MSTRDDRRWDLLLREHQDLRSADQSFVQQTAALLSVVIVTAAAVAVTLESQSGKHPKTIPGWVWPLFPLPLLGVLSLLVFLQVGSKLRTQYARKVEEAVQECVEFGQDFTFPSLFLMRREGWHFSRRVPYPPLLVSFWAALVTILTVIITINVVCIKFTRPHWLLVVSACLEGLAWLAIGAVYIPSLLRGPLWKRAQEALREQAESLESRRVGEDAARRDSSAGQQ